MHQWAATSCSRISMSRCKTAAACIKSKFRILPARRQRLYTPPKHVKFHCVLGRTRITREGRRTDKSTNFKGGCRQAGLFVFFSVSLLAQQRYHPWKAWLCRSFLTVFGRFATVIVCGLQWVVLQEPNLYIKARVSVPDKGS